ncbi:uncharacterized protein BDR25DRAFT_362108 [Lindgomyces ingoldianus]|uniref:Uncharacterized protein n=1 Tax=Lindgomyces ingoldianus TaxID=673940 RepID=A0ACB6QAS4_9PLEO|nr:uncharacterized protein BDR25DRAFT_362108 [Lindgomyces ingoldianus]KAF2464011.1 hypothetical protein BDR25DRAFT_362108 [Lindgomyces ingoldianus]
MINISIQTSTTNIMATPSISRSLEDLLDEMIHEIALKLLPIRKFAITIDYPITHDWEDNRYYENCTRRVTLSLLCLTSRRISRIVTPVLYSSIILHFTERLECCPTSLLLRTLLDKPHLAKRIRCIENRVEDVSEWQDDDAYHVWRLKAQQNRDTFLAAASRLWRRANPLIAISPNLNHLHLASYESFPPSIWDFVGFEVQDGPLIPRRFSKLRTLFIALDQRSYWIGGGEWFAQLIEHLRHLPALTYLHTCGMMCKKSSLSLTSGSLSLETLYLSHCTMELRQVSDLAKACQSLRHFALHYADIFVNENAFQMGNIQNSLLQHRQTLESIYIDIRMVKPIDLSKAVPSHAITSFEGFSALQRLTVCNATLFRDQDSFENPGSERTWEPFTNLRISAMLPRTLKQLTLLTDPILWSDEGAVLIKDLADDCAGLPNLEQLRVVSANNLPNLSAHFWNRKPPLETSPFDYLPCFI